MADLEQGVRTWMRPWSAENTLGKIARPLRHNGIPLQGHQCHNALVGGATERLFMSPLADL
ncbi:MAG: hypothetical protein WDN04_14225 [Rhodospirillales bacterium]